jgi:hypothetical protein
LTARPIIRRPSANTQTLPRTRSISRDLCTLDTASPQPGAAGLVICLFDVENDIADDLAALEELVRLAMV